MSSDVFTEIELHSKISVDSTKILQMRALDKMVYIQVNILSSLSASSTHRHILLIEKVNSIETVTRLMIETGSQLVRSSITNQ